MLGKAAVTIWCNVAPEVREEFDHWHAHEHMPERLSIPGFRRGSRWVSEDGGSYFILYEVESEGTLTSNAYLERLNNPTPWSRKMMAHHLGMVRSLCAVVSSSGSGLAAAMLTIRLSPRPESAAGLRQWLASELAGLPQRRGLAGARFLQDAGTKAPAPTTEQKIRGGDRTADWILLLNGYSAEALERLAAEALNEAALVAHGAAPGSIARIYRFAYSLGGKT